MDIVQGNCPLGYEMSGEGVDDEWTLPSGIVLWKTKCPIEWKEVASEGCAVDSVADVVTGRKGGEAILGGNCCGRRTGGKEEEGFLLLLVLFLRFSSAAFFCVLWWFCFCFFFVGRGRVGG